MTGLSTIEQIGEQYRTDTPLTPEYKGQLALVVVAALLVGCSTSTKSRDVSDSIRRSLDQAGLKDVTVTQDREKGAVTLGGHVAAEADKAQAESLAKAIAAEQVAANQIAVTPPCVESEAKTVNSDLDAGIEHS